MSFQLPLELLPVAASVHGETAADAPIARDQRQGSMLGIACVGMMSVGSLATTTHPSPRFGVGCTEV